MEILDAQDPKVRELLLDFRVSEKQQVAKLQGEGRFASSLFPEKTGQKVLVEYLPWTEWKRPPFLWRWLVALRAPYLIFSLYPLLFVFCTYQARLVAGDRPSRWLETALLFGGSFFLHVGSHFWGDAEDHLRGVDSATSAGGSGVIQKLWIPAKHLRTAAALFFLSGLALLLWLLVLLPIATLKAPLLGLGCFGALAAASYSGWPFHYKYYGLGEPILFLLAGPILAMGASLVFFSEEYLLWFALLSLPFSFLAVLRLHIGNMQRIPFDKQAGAKTIANLVSFPLAKKLLWLPLLAPFVFVSLFRFSALVPSNTIFLVFLSLPLALWIIHLSLPVSGPLDPSLRKMRTIAAWLHFAFGALFCFSIWLQ